MAFGGIGDWISEHAPDVSPDIPSWLSERASNVAGVAGAAKGNLGDIAKWATIPEYMVGRNVAAAYQPPPDFIQQGFKTAVSPFWAMGSPPGGGGGGGGGGGTSASSTELPDSLKVAPTNPNAAAVPNWHPLVNPLALSGFYSSTIAPLLKQMDERYMANTQAAQGKAADLMAKYPMPAEFQAYFAKERPQTAQNQLDLHTALQAAALQQPSYDATLKALGDVQNTSMQLYQQQLINNALVRSGLSSGTASQVPPAELAKTQPNGKTGAENVAAGLKYDGTQGP
jgi:hypothetical protein